MAHAAAAVARPRPLPLRTRRAPATRVGGRFGALGDGRAAYSSTRRRADCASDASHDVETPPVVHGDPDADLGDSAGPFRGVVTRRHTLGRKLTFVDLTCAAPNARFATPGGSVDDARETTRDPETVFVYAKCWGVVDKRVKTGAVVALRATHTRFLTTPPRPRDVEARKLGSESARVSVAEHGVALVAPPSAAATRNAAPFVEAGVAKPSSVGKSRPSPLIRPFAESDASSNTVGPSTSSNTSRLCRSFVARGACGDPRCAKRHAFASDAEREATASARRAAARRSRAAVSNERDPEDPHGDESRSGKQQSDRLFAAWLVETFALAPAGDADDGSNAEAARASGTARELNTHTKRAPGGANRRETREANGGDAHPRRRKKVADIAGGGGTLSFELHVRHGCDCVLVDPAFVALSPRQLGTWRNLRKRAALSGERGGAWRAWQRAERWVRVAARERDARRDAHVRRVLVNTDARETRETRASSDVRIRDGGEADAARGAADDASVARFEHFADSFWGELDGALGGAIASCDVLVGMHPDQATEPIVDAALRLNKPFAVVPCCVFPEAFPDRAGPDGAPVRSYAQFLEYLRAKDPGIEIAYLPFQGRSRVLYKR